MVGRPVSSLVFSFVFQGLHLLLKRFFNYIKATKEHHFFLNDAQWARKFKKVQLKKNSWNQINQLHEKFFWSESIFCNFTNGQNSIFELGKSLKPPKMQFHEKKILIYLISRVFCLDFFKFSRPPCCESSYILLYCKIFSSSG